MRRLALTTAILALLCGASLADNGELVVTRNEYSGAVGGEMTKATLTLTPRDDVRLTGLFQQSIKAAIASKAQELGMALTPLGGKVKLEGSYNQSGAQGALVDTTKVAASLTAVRGLTFSGAILNKASQKDDDARSYAVSAGWKGHLGTLTGSIEDSLTGQAALKSYKLKYSIYEESRLNVVIDAYMTEKGSAGSATEDVNATVSATIKW